jgi:hypothetical protein
MPDIEDFQEYSEYCFEVANRIGLVEEDIALQAFELLTANAYDSVCAHALGVSL